MPDPTSDDPVLLPEGAVDVPIVHAETEITPFELDDEE